MSFRDMLTEITQYMKNLEQTRLIERADRAVRQAGGRILSDREKGLKLASRAFEKINFNDSAAVWIVFGAHSEEEFEFSSGPLPDGLPLAWARGVAKQGPEAMDALAARLEKISALAESHPNRWGGEGAADTLLEIRKLRPEAERLAIKSVLAQPAAKRGSASRL